MESIPVVFVHGLWIHPTSWQPWIEYFRDAGYDPTAPWGPLSSSGPQCTFRYDRTTWNGQWVTLRVTIPGYNGGNGYTCPTGVSATPRDCWIKMEITPDAGVLSDATSWNAKLGGAPVRLVK